MVLLYCFKSVLLLCKVELSFKFFVILKIKVFMLLQNQKFKKLHAIIMHGKKKVFVGIMTDQSNPV